MKVAIVLSVLVTVVAANPIYNNESSKNEKPTNDWQMVRDTNGNLHIVHTNDAGKTEVEPNFVPISDIIFRLFTRDNPTTGQIIRIFNNTELAASHYNPLRQTRIHIHGWMSGGPNTGLSIRNAFVAHTDCNMFNVDWGVGAIAPIQQARARVNAVGQVTAQFIDWLNVQGQAFSHISAIGHSLGALVAGATGKRTTRGLLQSIVALDPANLVTFEDQANRVHHTDANYVEVIVTDAGGFGFELPTGHANFYPNGGRNQPGCGGNSGCSHGIFEDFYAASINNSNVFGAITCGNIDNIRNRECVISGEGRRMGGEPVMDRPSSPFSVYYLTTNPNFPFAQGRR